MARTRIAFSSPLNDAADAAAFSGPLRSLGMSCHKRSLAAAYKLVPLGVSVLQRSAEHGPSLSPSVSLLKLLRRVRGSLADPLTRVVVCGERQLLSLRLREQRDASVGSIFTEHTLNDPI